MSAMWWLRSSCVVIVLAAMAPLAAAQSTKKDVPASSSQDFKLETGRPGKDVVWMPTAKSVMDKMFEMAKLTPQDVLYDLGSGDGRVVIAAAKQGATAVGIEYDPKLVVLSRASAAKSRVTEKTTFVQGDIFQSDFSKATIVTLFLLPELNLKLRPALLNLKPGTRITANSFDMGDWKPDRFERLKGDCGSWCMAFLWIVPAKVGGTWSLVDGELALQQQYQHIVGTLRMKDKSFIISNGRLEGEEVFFSVGNVQFSGRVSGDAMKGFMTANASRVPWEAYRKAGK